ncbi:DUF1796 family putative cysteine peptidase [Pectobacterium versatile]|uniref:DUF1796 family putative cysteine peptidase n=1 Tax=Pectobacterium versatile TaxID=2488639 RepID=UPI000D1BC2CB|nr:DUF1796 family putative cysteine peptidase [Pectobacterium versatile]AVT56859.1 hypothetical protein OA04_01720 [Pectobacterium versatile]
MKKYDMIYSIGRDCACSEYLKKHGLRISSGPFDWLTNANFEERFTLLLNNFKNFLNPEDFIPLEKDPSILNDNNCDYYKNKSTNFYFYHDFPINVKFSESFNKVKEKYSRRIDRFYFNVKNKDKILLVWFSHYHATDDKIVIDNCNKLCKKLDKHIDFLIIEHDNNLSKDHIEKRQIADNILRANLHTIELDSSGNITTMGNENACNKIFSEYRLVTPLLFRVKRTLKRTGIKIICLFIPIRKWRKKIRSLNY